MAYHSKGLIEGSTMHCIETRISWGYANNCDYRPILTGFFFKYFSKVFGKGSWSAYNNITQCQNLEKMFP